MHPGRTLVKGENVVLSYCVFSDCHGHHASMLSSYKNRKFKKMLETSFHLSRKIVTYRAM